MPTDIHVAGDANIGGDLVGRDKTTRVSSDDARQDIRDLAEEIGKLSGVLTSVRIELAAMKERHNYQTIGMVGLIIVSNLVTLIVALLVR